MTKILGFLKITLLRTVFLLVFLYPNISLAEPFMSSNEIDSYLVGKCFSGLCSPLAGHGSVFFDNGISFQVDPRLVVAIAGAETRFGTDMSCNASFNAWSWFWKNPDACGDNSVSSWDEGIYWVTRQMWLYFTRDGLTTIPKIGAKYCAEGCENWVPLVTQFYHNELGGDTTDLGFSGTLVNGIFEGVVREFIDTGGFLNGTGLRVGDSVRGTLT